MPISKIKQAILRFGLTALSFFAARTAQRRSRRHACLAGRIRRRRSGHSFDELFVRPSGASGQGGFPRTTQSCSPLPRTGIPAGRNWKSRRLIFLHLLPYTRGPSPPQWRGASPLCCCC